MTETIVAPSGNVLHARAIRKTTSTKDTKPKRVRVGRTPESRLEANRELLKNENIKAFLAAVAAAEGGEYDFKFGATKGRKNDPWRFTDFSTHPGPGCDGKTTAAGRYQIKKKTWKAHASGMGLTDFSPDTQDLIAVDLLVQQKAIEAVKVGDLETSLKRVSTIWAALPEGKGLTGHYDGQPHVTYEQFAAAFAAAGGKVK